MSTDTAETMAIGKLAMNKAFWRILPLILVAYLFAYMDRVNVSFAAASMNEDLAFSATVYGLGGGLFFLGYALFEIPSNLMLVRYGARKWIARIMITWGLLSAAMMLCRRRCNFMCCGSCWVSQRRDFTLALFSISPTGFRHATGGVP